MTNIIDPYRELTHPDPECTEEYRSLVGDDDGRPVVVKTGGACCGRSYTGSYCPTCGIGPGRWECHGCGFGYATDLESCPTCGDCDATQIGGASCS